MDINGEITMSKRLLITAIVLLMILIGLMGFKFAGMVSESESDHTASVSDTESSENQETSDSEIEENIDSSAEESAESTSETEYDPEQDSRFFDTDSYLICANKKHPLPDGYEPSDLAWPEVDVVSARFTLRWDAAVALEEMFAAAAEDGVTLLLQSGYRSAEYQSQLWNYYAGLYGADDADTISSRPGYSDHQTGLAADIGSASNPSADLTQSFIDTAEGQWLYKHAYEYGFIMRYPVGKQDITGYAYEPWHYRYIGVEEATAIYTTDPDLSFEEYYGISGGDYAD